MARTRSQTGALKHQKSWAHLKIHPKGESRPKKKVASTAKAFKKPLQRPNCCPQLVSSKKTARKEPSQLPQEALNRAIKLPSVQSESSTRSMGNIEAEFLHRKASEIKRLKLQSSLEFKPPKCSCPDLGPSGPFYTQLGCGSSLAQLRRDFETRTGFTGREIRFERVQLCAKEGKTEQGCPVAKWVISRRSKEEQLLIVTKARPGHSCATAVQVVSIVAWEGLNRAQADHSYDFLRSTVGNYGIDLQRRCTTNPEKTCACQGLQSSSQGGSFTFGCSKAKFQSLCKYNRCSPNNQAQIRKFRMIEEAGEEPLQSHFDSLASQINPIFSLLAPQAHHNMALSDGGGNHCRIGHPARPGHCPIKERRPFASVSAVMDFCAHAHRDSSNMEGGVTTIVTLTKPENRDKFGHEASQVEDEQLHVLPHYRPVLDADEYGSQEGMAQLVREGAVTALTQFERRLTRRAAPLTGKNTESQKLILNQSTDCKELFEDPEVGGVSLRLPHGSVLFEYAKAELHATTALKEPNRKNPTRIGVVFYQHGGLEYPFHGYSVGQEQAYYKYRQDYDLWKQGKFLFSKAQIAGLVKMGFKFPSETIQTVDRPGSFQGVQITQPDLSFLRGDPSGGIPPAPAAVLVNQVLKAPDVEKSSVVMKERISLAPETKQFTKETVKIAIVAMDRAVFNQRVDQFSQWSKLKAAISARQKMRNI